MIIKCPICGFSGRVPSYVSVVPHHARCPKCQHRFALSELATQPAVAADEGSRPDLRHDLARPRLDPSSSSYEIEALTDDFEDDDRALESNGWDDDWDDAADLEEEEIEDDDEAPSAIAKPTRLPGFLLRGAERPIDPDDPPALTAVVSVWRVRLFEGWAILFVVWAALIGGRAILATVVREQEFLFSSSALWPVAAVVLLVVASAGLFLLIDLSRRFAAPVAIEPTSGAVPSPAPVPPAQAPGAGRSGVLRSKRLSAG